MHQRDDQIGSHLGSADDGLAVEQIDTRNLKSQRVEKPRRDAWEYITDGRGHVRIVGIGKRNGRDQNTGTIDYEYHPAGSSELKPLSIYHYTDQEGFNPYAVDPDLNVAYGVKKHDGRLAVYSVALNEGLKEQLLYASPDVDVTDLIYVGRQRRVVGATYYTDYRHSVYFAPEMLQIRPSAHEGAARGAEHRRRERR